MQKKMTLVPLPLRLIWDKKRENNFNCAKFKLRLSQDTKQMWTTFIPPSHQVSDSFYPHYSTLLVAKLNNQPHIIRVEKAEIRHIEHVKARDFFPPTYLHSCMCSVISAFVDAKIHASIHFVHDVILRGFSRISRMGHILGRTHTDCL